MKRSPARACKLQPGYVLATALLGIVSVGCTPEPRTHHPPLLHEVTYIPTQAVINGKTVGIADIPMLERQRVEGNRKLHQRDAKPFDLNHDGDVDRDLVVPFARARMERRRAEVKRTRDHVVRQFDANRDGTLTRAELALVDTYVHRLDDMRREKKLPLWTLHNWAFERKYFDTDGDGLLSDAEFWVRRSYHVQLRRGGEPDDVIEPHVSWRDEVWLEEHGGETQ